MKRQKVVRALMLIGSGFIALAVVAFIAQIFPYPAPQGGMYGGIAAVGQDIVIFAGFWGSFSLGVLLLLGSCMIKLKWWWAWPLYFVLGMLMTSQYGMLADADDFKRILVLQSPASAAFIHGIACFVAGVVVTIAFWIVRATESSKPQEPSGSFISSPLNLQ